MSNKGDVRMRTILSCVLVLGLILCLSSDLVAEPKTTPISITQLRKELIGVGLDPVMEKFLHVPGPDVLLNPGEGLRWIYKLECFDPGNGKTYPEVEVHFKIGGEMDGKVDYVRPWDASWDKFFNERALAPIFSPNCGFTNINPNLFFIQISRSIFFI